MPFLTLASKSMTSRVIAALAVGASFLAPVAAPRAIAVPEQTERQVAQAGTIVDVAAGSEDFETLVTAVQAAGLVDTLSSDGPFTVFAPTDAAFAELPAPALEALLEPENQDLLVEVLTYHVVPGAVMSGDLSSGTVETVNGEEVAIDLDSGVMVNSATVVTADVEASNGVIHVIDEVLVPASTLAELTARMEADETMTEEDDDMMTEEAEAETAEPVRALW